MKEEYVTYSQAVKLKELGFKNKCNAYYWTEDKAFECTNRIVHKNSDTCQTVVMAPFRWQAQAYLREKGIIVYTKPIVKSVGDEELQGFKFILKGYRFHVIKLDNARHLTSYDYPTDELALSAGIDAALKLLGKEVNNA